MLARFENGYFLEVIAVIEDCPEESTYDYDIYDEERDYVKGRWTEYRNIELYYPMNEIDYILQFCEPLELKNMKGKYEILPYESMEDYEEYLDYLEDGNADGDWCLERQGTDYDDVRYYKTEEDAKAAMLNEASSEEYEDYEPDIDYPCCEASGEEYYQKWTVYKKHTYKTETERILNEIQLEIDRTYNGISQYAWELQDTYVIEKHLTKVEKLVNKLKEMI